MCVCVLRLCLCFYKTMYVWGPCGENCKQHDSSLSCLITPTLSLSAPLPVAQPTGTCTERQNCPHFLKIFTKQLQNRVGRNKTCFIACRIAWLCGHRFFDHRIISWSSWTRAKLKSTLQETGSTNGKKEKNRFIWVEKEKCWKYSEQFILVQPSFKYIKYNFCCCHYAQQYIGLPPFIIPSISPNWGHYKGHLLWVIPWQLWVPHMTLFKKKLIPSMWYNCLNFTVLLVQFIYTLFSDHDKFLV